MKMKRTDLTWDYLLAMVSSMNGTNNWPPAEVSEDPPAWSALPILTLIILAGTVLGNAALLVYLRWIRVHLDVLWMYLGNLLLANILYQGVTGSLAVIDRVYSYWWLADAVCTLYLYAQYALLLVQITARGLVTLQALFLCFGHARWIGQRTVAGYVCLGGWVAVHAYCAFGIVRDAGSRIPLDYFGCRMNVFVAAVRGWLAAFGAARVALFLFVVVGFVVLACKQPVVYKNGKDREVTEVTRKTELHSEVEKPKVEEKKKDTKKEAEEKKKETKKEKKKEKDKEKEKAEREKELSLSQPVPSSEFVTTARLATYTGLELHLTTSASTNGLPVPEDLPGPSNGPPGTMDTPSDSGLTPQLFQCINRRLTLLVLLCWTPKVIHMLLDIAMPRSAPAPNVRDGLSLWYDLAGMLDPLVVFLSVPALRRPGRRRHQATTQEITVNVVSTV
ncbi:uncharacterized protein LOC129593225 [Paramacrobiotus metropolitanus]|uniref:uncharacterized protein LOC129593225 n=1 Tax=Paramacrobiotus metropolitanus TaxID=2943436 RepID=UPI002446545D|nr:uncharacterized protein LOC129593225 [Paramacrobiotus metropolitanus]